MKRLITLILTLCMLLVITACGENNPTGNNNAPTTPPATSQTPSEGLEFARNGLEDSYAVIGIGTCEDLDIVIPAKHEGLPVTTIGERAFYGYYNLTSVTIPDSITAIGNAAFNNCGSLTAITIPDSVTTIGDLVFALCSKLTGIWVGDGNTAYSSDEKGVLFNKDKTVIIQAPGALDGVYTIPDSVTTIGNTAFAYCNSLTNIVIGEGVTTIGNHAFYNCDKLTSFVVPDGVTTISEGVFLDCGRLTSVTIPNSITTIERTVFSYCSSLTNVYYKGTQAEWEQIFVDGSNEDLLNAQITFNN